MADFQKIPLSVFFPCYNEQENLPMLIEEAVNFLPEVSNDFEIIVVDDGSVDNTLQIAKNFSATNPAIKVVSHEVNLGYGEALKSGFKNATKDFVFYTDGDKQFSILDLKKIIPLMTQPRSPGIVSCYRMNRQDSLLRRANGKLWSNLMRILFGLKIKDVDCAFKLYRREIFDKISLKSSGALIDTEVLARASKKGYKIIQYPVLHYPRIYGQSSGGDLKVVFKAFTELLKLWVDIVTDH